MEVQKLEVLGRFGGVKRVAYFIRVTVLIHFKESVFFAL